MRLFVALALPAPVLQALGDLLRELRASAPELKWVRPGNLHVTLKFIGETPRENLGAISAALAGLGPGRGISAALRGLGFFPDGNRPQVLWTGIAPPEDLAALAARIEGALEPAGVPRETRAFRPHLTLARFSGTRLNQALAGAVARNQTRELGAFRSAEFQLMESKLKPQGAEYTTVETFHITGAEAGGSDA